MVSVSKILTAWNKGPELAQKPPLGVKLAQNAPGVAAGAPLEAQLRRGLLLLSCNNDETG